MDDRRDHFPSLGDAVERAVERFGVDPNRSLERWMTELNPPSALAFVLDLQSDPDDELCPVCGSPFQQPATGRRRETCSRACTVAWGRLK